MNAELTNIVEQCAAFSLASKIAFPDVVQTLAQAGVERYHADYSRQEITYYWPDGTSHVVPTPHSTQPTGSEFSASLVADAVRQSQQGEHTYNEFVRKTMVAGCVGYFVQLTGRRVIYFGRHGDSHTEFFPPAPTQ